MSSDFLKKLNRQLFEALRAQGDGSPQSDVPDWLREALLGEAPDAEESAAIFKRAREAFAPVAENDPILCAFAAQLARSAPPHAGACAPRDGATLDEILLHGAYHPSRQPVLCTFRCRPLGQTALADWRRAYRYVRENYEIAPPWSFDTSVRMLAAARPTELPRVQRRLVPRGALERAT